MKKYTLIVFLCLLVLLLVNHCSNDLVSLFFADHFYKPIASARIDVSRKGTHVRLKIKENYKVEHGVFLAIKASEDATLWAFDNSSGSINYSFSSGGEILELKTIEFPSSPVVIQTSSGILKILLFRFDIPFSRGLNDLYLDVTVVKPIEKIEQYQKIVDCLVAPAYWPRLP